MKYISELKPAAAQPRPNAKVMTNAMPRIVFGVLEVILRQDPVPGQSFGAGQGQIAFIVSLGVLSVPRLGAGEPGRLISPGGLGPSSGQWARIQIKETGEPAASGQKSLI
jgi:hypothetical protein